MSPESPYPAARMRWSEEKERRRVELDDQDKLIGYAGLSSPSHFPFSYKVKSAKVASEKAYTHLARWKGGEVLSPEHGGAPGSAPPAWDLLRPVRPSPETVDEKGLVAVSAGGGGGGYSGCQAPGAEHSTVRPHPPPPARCHLLPSPARKPTPPPQLQPSSLQVPSHLESQSWAREPAERLATQPTREAHWEVSRQR
jgi:hypothetical protein